MVAEPVDAPSREELIALIQAQASQIGIHSATTIGLDFVSRARAIRPLA
jgi:hypothetical protein